jgi:outer membrane immunogenic protein
MKRVLLSAVAFAALMGSASAADIPRRVEQVRAAPVAYVTPVYNWSGFYAGINGGFGWGTGSFSGPPASGDFDTSGGLFGGTLGYNWQTNQVVFGVETDLDWSDIKGSAACGGGVTCRVSNDWLGTARGRIGFAMDRVMPYVTGGLAFGKVNAAATGGNPGTSDTRTGWTLGGGVEFALAGNWTAKGEYLYVDLGDFNCGTRCGAPVGPDRVEFRSHIVRAGLNYRF